MFVASIPVSNLKGLNLVMSFWRELAMVVCRERAYSRGGQCRSFTGSCNCRSTKR